jgi:pimeloyl-ACP methyl ester carboxylesterase
MRDMPTLPPHLPGVEHRDVALGDVTLHVALAGPQDGPAIVLLHGWPQHWWMWHEVLGALAGAGHRVVAPDLRGFGWSSVPDAGHEKAQLAADVLALCDALGLGRFAVAGHDWGGWVAQLVALSAPNRVTRLAVANIPPVWTTPRQIAPHLWRFGHIVLNSSPWLGAAWQRTGLMRRALLGVPDAQREVYAERFRDPARARFAQRLYRTFLLHEAFGGTPEGRVACPLLVVFGDADPVIPAALVERFGDRAADLEVRWVHGAGHFVVDERPAEVLEALLEFLAPERAAQATASAS